MIGTMPSPYAMRYSPIVQMRKLLTLFLAVMPLSPCSEAAPPELESAERRFQELLKERVEGPFQNDLDRLSKSYLAALDREIRRKQAANDLDALVALTGEKFTILKME